MIPILVRNASKVKINLAQEGVKHKAIDVLGKIDDFVPEKFNTVEAKPSKLQENRALKKTKVNIMNLQLIPGEEQMDEVKEVEENRVREMIEKRRAESSMEKLKQKERFRVACASLLHGKHLRMNSK